MRSSRAISRVHVTDCCRLGVTIDCLKEPQALDIALLDLIAPWQCIQRLGRHQRRFHPPRARNIASSNQPNDQYRTMGSTKLHCQEVTHAKVESLDSEAARMSRRSPFFPRLWRSLLRSPHSILITTLSSLRSQHEALFRRLDSFVSQRNTLIATLSSLVAQLTRMDQNIGP
jgi:hypothetical protein